MHKNCRVFFVSIVMFVPFALNAIPVKLSNQNASVGFSPNSGAFDVILNAINEAKSSINLAAFVITSDDIFNALVNAHHRGVNVRVVVDAKSASGNGSDVQSLLDANIPVSLNNEFKIMHNKYIVIDNKSVQTGSFNYSNNADKRNPPSTHTPENRVGKDVRQKRQSPYRHPERTAPEKVKRPTSHRYELISLVISFDNLQNSKFRNKMLF